ncbi:DUF3986 family protein [Polycladomyces zharkentensis]|nr:DUF3986 family protein [Polycladomyces sp. WAk]
MFPTFRVCPDNPVKGDNGQSNQNTQGTSSGRRGLSTNQFCHPSGERTLFPLQQRGRHTGMSGDMGHGHVGFYEDGYDIEAIGFENEEETWDVYFNDFMYEGLFGLSHPRDKTLGVLIFKAKSYDDAWEKFHEWVKNVWLPFKESAEDTSRNKPSRPERVTVGK